MSVPVIRRRVLLAYLVGAGVAGTVLVGPYAVRRLVESVLTPLRAAPVLPFFTLPVVWGAWNVAWAVRRPCPPIGAWGAALGGALGCAVNIYIWWAGAWFGGALLLPPFLLVVYYLIWRLVIGPLNEALGVDGDEPR